MSKLPSDAVTAKVGTCGSLEALDLSGARFARRTGW